VKIHPRVFFRPMRVARQNRVRMQQIHMNAHCPLS
jgi:hypothetical protein